MKFEDISSREDFEEHFFHDKGFVYIDEETFWIDREHKAKYYFTDDLNYSHAYQLFREKKGVHMTPYYIFIDNDFDVYYIFSEYHTPFKFVYDKNRRERDYTKLSRLQLLNALKYEDKAYNDSFQALFDTKPLVKKFYDEYKVIKTRLSDSLKGLDDDERWFYSQVLLDRIIFIYFLQSREIIEKDYLTNLYRNRDKKRNFFNDYLKPLFFNAFNYDHPFHEKIEVNGVNLGNIPYLNGGLFRKKEVEIDNEISIKDGIWGEIFRLFDSYEWVVEERHEDAVVLTPSILGHIFEQSVTGRKCKGAYYTPSEITEYISMNTIYPYLRDRLNERFGTDYKNIWSELLDKQEFSKNEIDRVSYLYFNILKELRVLDNACGSGAFLMAAHKILLALYRKCYRILKDELVFSAENKAIDSYGSPDYYFKRIIATQNIYGVDLEDGAVEIAKLRLWLSMISDLSIESVEPLPNIDYNIMHGNSLIGFVEAPLVEQTTLDSADTTMQIIKAKGALLDQYKATTDPKIAENLKRDIERINEKFRPELNEKFHRMLTVDYKIKISKEELEALHPFHWGFEFYEVFDPDRPKGERGFDILIGNPPYVKASKIPAEKKIFNKIYSTAYGPYDIYILFFEKSINVLNEKGLMGYITSNKYFVADYGKKLRDFLLKNCTIREIIDFSKAKSIFQDALVSTAVMILRKEKNERDYQVKIIIIESEKELGTLNKNKGKSIKKSELIDSASGHFQVFSDKSVNEILSSSSSNSVPLGQVGDVRTGVMGFEYWNMESYIHEGKTDKKSCKIVTNSYIKPYGFLWGKNVKIYKKNFNFPHISIESAPLSDDTKDLFLQKNKIIIRGVAKKLTAAIDTEGIGLLVAVHSFSTNDIEKNKYILTLLNSKLFNWIHKKKFYSARIPQGSLRYPISFLKDLPIIIPEKITGFLKLSSYLIFLNNNAHQVSKIIDFFSGKILDSLIYSLYFKEKFQEDGVPTNLAELVEPYLIDIEELGSDEEKMTAIEKVYEEITADGEIMETIKKIKSHPWVKVIEGENA